MTPNLHGATQEPLMAQETSTTTSIRVQGMDCAACGMKNENALPRMVVVAEVNVSFAVGMADGESAT